MDVQLSLFPDLDDPNRLVAEAIEGTRNTSGIARLVRTSGSYVDELLTDVDGEQTVGFLSCLNFTEVTIEMQDRDLSEEGCRYFRAPINDLFNGYLGAKTLDELCSEVVGITLDEWDELPNPSDERESYKKRLNGLLADIGPMTIGDHDAMFEISNVHYPVDFITVITGPSQDRNVIYTWFPGDPAGKSSRLKDVTVHFRIS